MQKVPLGYYSRETGSSFQLSDTLSGSLNYKTNNHSFIVS